MNYISLLRAAIRVSSLLLLFTANAVVSLSQPAQRQDALNLFQRGIEMEKANKHQEALDLFRQAVRLDPNFAEAYWGMGSALVGLGQFAQALEALQQVVRLKPEAK